MDVVGAQRELERALERGSSGSESCREPAYWTFNFIFYPGIVHKGGFVHFKKLKIKIKKKMSASETDFNEANQRRRSSAARAPSVIRDSENSRGGASESERPRDANLSRTPTEKKQKKIIRAEAKHASISKQFIAAQNANNAKRKRKQPMKYTPPEAGGRDDGDNFGAKKKKEADKKSFFQNVNNFNYTQNVYQSACSNEDYDCYEQENNE